MTKIDFKKEFPEIYKPSTKEISLLTIPKMKFFMIDGEGDPNTAPDFIEAIECLYSVSFALKMRIVKKEDPTKDYVVPPLEGLWFADDLSVFSLDRKNLWNWTLMIRIPDFVSEDQIERSIITIAQKQLVALNKLRWDSYDEGLSVQIMYIGPYEDEGPTIKRLHDFASLNNLEPSGKHHEIYISDPRKAKPGSMKTVIRQPVKKIDR